MFEFTIPWNDVADTITNLSFLNSPILNENGFVGIENGHFVYNGERIRFFGANLGRGANFPSHEESEIAAGRLAKLGCNLVRLCIMDMDYAPEGIFWVNDEGSKRQLDPVQLERLDYLIYQLKGAGIFVNLNLHVSRQLTSRDGIVDDPNMPDFNKGVDIFDPTMIDRHREYAHDLLTHVNQYTNLAYYNDPVIAMVEVTNEDSLLAVWKGWGGKDIDSLGSFYQIELDDLWKAWWHQRYPGSAPRRPTRDQITAGEGSEEIAHRYVDFLLRLEEEYHEDMVDFLKNLEGSGVGVKVPISGTQVGTLDGVLSSSFHDQHGSYATWDNLNLFFLDSITKYPFKQWHRPIPGITSGKVTGKPYIATEVSSPWPNYHAAEPILLSALYAAFQDWDGLILFAYRGNTVWNYEYVAMKYDFDRHMTKMVAITVAALLFRRHDVTVGGDPLTLITTRQDVLEHPWNNASFDFTFVTRAIGNAIDPFVADEGHLPAYATLMRRMEIDKGETHSVSDPPDPPQDHIFLTDTGELEWQYDPENIDPSFFKADTENVQALAGKIDTEDRYSFSRGVLSRGSISVDPITSSALIAVILVQTTPDFRTYLIIATGEMENTEFAPSLGPPGLPQLYYLPEPQENYWGHEPVLVEGIGAHITLPVPAGNVIEFLTLYPDGSDHVQLDPEPQGEHCILHLSPDNETLWYRVVIRI